MEALILEYENREALNKVLDILAASDVKSITATTLSQKDLQLIGKRKLVQLKEMIDSRPEPETDDITEAEIQSTIEEVRQKMYDEGLHNRH